MSLTPKLERDVIDVMRDTERRAAEAGGSRPSMAGAGDRFGALVTPAFQIGKSRVERILSDVADRHGVYPSKIKSKSRKALPVRARDHAAYRLRAELGLSYPKIGQLLGGRNHSTIMTAIKRHCVRKGLEVPK